MATRTKRHPLRTWRGPERPYDLIAEGTIAVIIVACSASWPRSCGGPRTVASPTRAAPNPRPGRRSAPGTGIPTTRRTWPRRRCRSWPAGRRPPGTARRSTRPPGPRRRFIGIKPAEIAKAIFGLTLPINTANDFVLAPVSQLAAPSSPAVAAAVSLYKAAGGDLRPARPVDQVASSRQMTWLNNYAKALSGSSAKFTPTSITVPAGNYGPVPVDHHG